MPSRGYGRARSNAARAVALLAVLLLLASACTGAGRRANRKSTPTGGGVTNTTTPSQVSARGKPNVLILLTDDQSFHLFDRTLEPVVFRDLVDQGVQFTRAYVNVSQCCPSRSTILTGLYSHDTGVDSNTTPLDGREPLRPTFPQALHEAGYRTMLAGKYLNSESCDPQPGWDRWVCGTQGSEVDPTLTVDGRTSNFQGYTADIEADHVVDFLRRNDDPNHPFFVYYAPKDPHLPANDRRQAKLDVPFYDPPSYDSQPDPASKPAYARIAPLPTSKLNSIRLQYEHMAQQIPPLDADIGRILAALGQRSRDTLVVFASDNGYLYGEHRMTGKQVPYEESARVPFVIRYPALVSAPLVSDALVSNADIAPTIMDLADIPWDADGRSLVPLLKGEVKSVRDDLLLEWCEASDKAGRCSSATGSGRPPPFWGIETDRYVYVEYGTGERELYDLQADPFELVNLAGERARAALADQLSARLALLRRPTSPPGTSVATGPSGEVHASAVSFTYFSQARTTVFRCRLLGPGRPSAWASCDEGMIGYSVAAPGRYTFEVQAVGADGVSDPTPAERTFQIAA